MLTEMNTEMNVKRQIYPSIIDLLGSTIPKFYPAIFLQV